LLFRYCDSEIIEDPDNSCIRQFPSLSEFIFLLLVKMCKNWEMG
jgi:hypothetical protein